jgi:hypothetical protein
MVQRKNHRHKAFSDSKSVTIHRKDFTTITKINKEDTATFIRRLWTRKLAQEASLSGMTTVIASTLSFKQLRDRVAQSATLLSTGRLVRRLCRMNVTTTSSSFLPLTQDINMRKFMTAFMVVYNDGGDMFNYMGVVETELFQKAEAMLASFDKYSSVLRDTPVKIGIAQLVLSDSMFNSLVHAYLGAFDNWERLETYTESVLMVNLLEVLYEAEDLLPSTWPETTRIAKRFSAMRHLLRNRIARLNGVVTCINQIETSIATSRTVRRQIKFQLPKDGDVLLPDAWYMTGSTCGESSRIFLDDAEISHLDVAISNALESSNPAKFLLPETLPVNLIHELMIDPRFHISKDRKNNAEDTLMEDVRTTLNSCFFRRLSQELGLVVPCYRHLLYFFEDIHTSIANLENPDSSLHEKSKPWAGVKASIDAVIDLSSIKTKIKQGLFDWVSCFKIARDAMVVLQQHHPLSVTKGSTSNPISTALWLSVEESLKTPGMYITTQHTVLCRALLFIQRNVKDAHVSTQNKLIDSARDFVFHHGEQSERHTMDKNVVSGSLTFQRTSAWLKSTISRDNNARLYKTASDDDLFKIRGIIDLLCEGIVYTTCVHPVSLAVDIETLPETLIMDVHHIRKIRARFNLYTTISSIVSILFLFSKDLLRTTDFTAPVITAYVTKLLLKQDILSGDAKRLVVITMDYVRRIMKDPRDNGLLVLQAFMMKHVEDKKSTSMAFFNTRIANVIRFRVKRPPRNIKDLQDPTQFEILEDTLPNEVVSIISPLIDEIAKELLNIVVVNTKIFLVHYTQMVVQHTTNAFTEGFQNFD